MEQAFERENEGVPSGQPSEQVTEQVVEEAAEEVVEPVTEEVVDEATEPVSEEAVDAQETAEQARLREAAQVNDRNTRCAVDCGGAVPDYYTPEQVRCMTRAEVHEHYALIIESMKHWQ